MKIGILTHYQAESHGACLQHYALTQYLRQLGHEVYTLTYVRDFTFSPERQQKKFSVNFHSIPFYIKEYLLKLGPAYVWTMARKHFRLRKFSRTHFQFLPYNTCGLDAVIVGSDEVWSLQTGVDAMMFGHGVNAGKLIAYAPSFGQTTQLEIQDRGCQALLQAGLSSFDRLSARDSHTQQLTATLIGQHPALVCDPALLYDFDAELTAHRHRVKTPYVVVYAYSSDLNEPDRVDAILSYARSIGAKVYAVGSFHPWCHRQITCDPLELLGWFIGASAVFTDPFHGTIAAFVCRRPMAVWVRPSNCKKLEHLLSVLGLKARRVTGQHPLRDVMAEPIDFDTLHSALQALRADSAAWLEQALEFSCPKEGNTQ